ncbi:MAG: response regulator [Fusobacteriota bacterium]
MSEKRVLVLDDEMFTRKILQMNLEKEGNKVDLADDVFMGESLVKRNKYDLIIVDLILPIQSGFDFIKIIREIEKNKDTDVIILSSKKLKKDLEKASEYNVKKFIKKPFDIKEIIEIVKKS